MTTPNVNIPLSAALVATLAAGTPVTVTLTPPTPSVATPPAPTPEPFYLYKDGVANWPLFWISGATADYAHVATDGTKCILFTATEAWAMLMPYPPSEPGNPSNNGIAFQTKGYTKFGFSIRPAKAGSQVQSAFYSTTGVYVGPDAQTPDTPITSPVLLQAPNGPDVMTEGEWNVYEAPLTLFGVELGEWIYKAALQQSGVTPQVWEINDIAFFP